MTEIDILIPVMVAFLTAALTLMTGFGLGTILTPIFLIFYDVKIAILIVAVVHLSNNLLKVFLFFKHINLSILKRFGVLVLVGSLVGATLQGTMDSSIVKILLGLSLIFLGLKEVLGLGEKMRFPQKVDFIGGFFSGLMGGFVGNQGAIRSAFLLNYRISKEAFVATAAVLASIVDIARIPVYILNNRDVLADNLFLVTMTTAAAFTGTVAGKKLLRNIPVDIFRKYVAFMVIIVGVLLSLGII